MATIRPLRAHRYNPERFPDIGAVTSPLFDVVTPAQLEELYAHPANSIHLSVPRAGAPESPAAIVRRWKDEGILQLEPVPAIYVYYQHYTLPGESDPQVRKGFICLIEATPWGQGPVHRHESTIPDGVKDRLETLRQTRMQVNPTHGLYHDPLFELEPYMDEAMASPLYETEDYQGVRDVIALIQDREVIRRFMDVMAGHQIVLADGHHRYEASVALRREIASQDPDPDPGKPYHWHLMYLTNDCHQGLRIMATHRLLRTMERWSLADWQARLAPYFELRSLTDATELPDILAGKRHAFGLALPGGETLKLRLKPGMLERIDWGFPEVVRELDVTVLHYFIIWRLLGIPGHLQRRSAQVAYDRNLIRCLRTLEAGGADAVVVVNPVTVGQVRAVAELGQTMPPKTTYFYPKVLAGFVFASLVDEEFRSPVDLGLGLTAAATAS